MSEHWNAKIIREQAERERAMEFTKGQRVRVEYIYEGEVMSNGPHTLNIQVEGGHVRMLNMNQPDVKVIILDPAEWPPRRGDIWQTEPGDEDKEWQEWFCAYSPAHGEYRMMPDSRGIRTLGLNAFKALNPVLVRRRGQ